MRKAIILSSIALMILSTSANARWDDDRGKQNKKVTKKVKTQKRYVAPKLRKGIRRVPAYRPRHVVLPRYRPGYRVNRLPRTAFYFVLGGISYHYLSGVYYRPYLNEYRVVSAPIGAIVYTLPIGHVSVVIGSRNYYMYNNIYYLWDGRRSGYRVVDMPRGDYIYDSPTQSYSVGVYHYRLGDIVLNLPAGSIQVIIDGVSYYENEGVYFLPARRNGKRVYKVVDVY